jgi:hypothetical protein
MVNRTPKSDRAASRNGVSHPLNNSSLTDCFTHRRPKRRMLKPRLEFEWTKAIDEEHWQCYRRAINALRNAGIRFMLGGGFAGATYTGRWRNTKDIDFYIDRKDRHAAVAALTKAGFEDFYPTLAYDRKWIYRSTCSGVIVDIIWAMANQRAQVDDLWFDNSVEAMVRGERLQVIPLEEFLWCKLYIVQRDHCDWVDIFNLLYAAGEHIHWNHLLWRLEEDWPLLQGLLTVYGWLCPARARELPALLRKTLQLPEPKTQRNRKYDRIRLLDSRRWFAAILPKDKPLEV